MPVDVLSLIDSEPYILGLLCDNFMRRLVKYLAESFREQHWIRVTATNKNIL